MIPYVPTQLDPEDELPIRTLVQALPKTELVIVEIGSFMGGSALIIADVLQHRPYRLYAIDIWENQGIYDTFCKHTQNIPNIYPWRMPSLEAVRYFQDQSIDFIFIDGSHKYTDVYADIQAWLPKCKKDGIVAGHDCERKYTEYNEGEQQDIITYAETEKTPFRCHPGVIKALYDIFHDDYVHVKDTRIWYKVIK